MAPGASEGSSTISEVAKNAGGRGGRGGLMGAIGPGLLFAGTAVGTSHLVQATRAGAMFGFGLLIFVILALVAKYAAFRFGSEYASHTGRSLLQGYRRIGKLPVLLFLVYQTGSGSLVSAVLVLVLAGIITSVFSLTVPITMVTAALLTASALILFFGRYRWLDRINTALMVILTIATLIATVLVLPNVTWDIYPASAPDFDRTTWLFIAALMGWMPTGVDVSISTSLWAVAKAKVQGKPAHRHAIMDFNIGYWGTALLAICFVILGNGTMHTAGITPENSPPGLARQIIDLYVTTLGPWSAPIVAVSIFSVMSTTCLAAFDAFPRSIWAAVAALKGPPETRAPEALPHLDQTLGYRVTMIAMMVLAQLILVFYFSGFTAFIDLVTTISFLVAPVFAYVNHRVMHNTGLSADALPPRWLTIWSWLGILFLAGFALFYLWVVFF